MDPFDDDGDLVTGRLMPLTMRFTLALVTWDRCEEEGLEPRDLEHGRPRAVKTQDVSFCGS